MCYYVEGGRSGINSNRAESTDPLTHTSGGRAYGSFSHTRPIFILRKTANGGEKKDNGFNGASSTFSNHILPY